MTYERAIYILKHTEWYGTVYDLAEVEKAITTFEDATPNSRGHWEEKEIGDHPIDQWQSARCSVCGKYLTTPYMYYFNSFDYCPSCGALMGARNED